jgi:hypothetical protein
MSLLLTRDSGLTPDGTGSCHRRDRGHQSRR